MVEQVLDCVARAGRAVEDAADDDGVVGGVVVAQGALGVVLAPGKLRPAEQSAEKAHVQRVEDFIEVVVAAFRAEVALGPRAWRISSVCRVTAAEEAKRL